MPGIGITAFDVTELGNVVIILFIFFGAIIKSNDNAMNVKEIEQMPTILPLQRLENFLLRMCEYEHIPASSIETALQSHPMTWMYRLHLLG